MIKPILMHSRDQDRLASLGALTSLVAFFITSIQVSAADPQPDPQQAPPQQQAQQQAPPQQQLQQTQRRATPLQRAPQNLQLQQAIQPSPYQNTLSASRSSKTRVKSAATTMSEGDILERLPKVEPQEYQAPQVHLAILLDVSGSMNGLINQARAELWKVVNTFNGVTQGGVVPEIRVALYSYGNADAGEYGVYVNQLVPLTTDLDQVSEVLFALKTSGSQELCSTAILAATRGQAWSAKASDLKAIIIAGNETFLQGPITPMRAVKEAGAIQIKTHTIHCGSLEEGVRDHWREAAELSGGQFMNINQDATEEFIPTPFDDKLEALNRELNSTYIPYGAHGRAGQAKQVAQDANAARVSKSSALSRGLTKSGSYYNNAHWDLVDAYQREGLKVEELSVDQLPETMRSLSPEARVGYVKDTLKKRGSIQRQIADLSKQRLAFIEKVRAAKSADQGDRIDSAMIKALRDQATSTGFTWSSSP